ncbi:helix-turn-helix domain-containing protein [Burkholderia pseudomallei]|uniref:helix-turn-helix domain-containing protein n=1 Tax=Burkholderia pseudomallei TaxID=28450 RepID=UPI0005CAD738|nr:helix-turn-helix transcriptional regulator [Burkholderia pseudomallei]KIX36900.1 transcriptional regulator [Burkholderia pseudomallei]
MSKHSADDAEAKRSQLAQRLRDAREYAGLSQEEVASALGISRPAVTNIEAGLRKVEAVELDKLSTLYGRTVQYLLTGETRVDEGRLAFLARATHGLTERDLEELGRFAAFLRNTPRSKRKEP